MKHWWNFERINNVRSLQHEMGYGYRRQEMLYNGENLADVQRLYDEQLGGDHQESAYMADDNFDTGAAEEFAPANYADIAAVEEEARDAAEAAAAAVIAAGDG
jgi:hypothetical protein